MTSGRLPAGVTGDATSHFCNMLFSNLSLRAFTPDAMNIVQVECFCSTTGASTCQGRESFQQEARTATMAVRFKEEFTNEKVDQGKTFKDFVPGALESNRTYVWSSMLYAERHKTTAIKTMT